MSRPFKSALTLCAALFTLTAAAFDEQPVRLTNYDAHLAELSSLASGNLPTLPLLPAGRLQAQIDKRMGVPTFLWAEPGEKVLEVGPLVLRERLAAQARAFLAKHATTLRIDEAALEQAEVYDAQYNGAGPAVVRLRQLVGGLPVFQRNLNVMLDRAGKPVAASGYFANATAGADRPVAISAAQALATAITGYGGGSLAAAGLTATRMQGAWQHFAIPALSGPIEVTRGPRVRPVLYARSAGLEPAWHLEVFAQAPASGELFNYAFVISALDGSLLNRSNLTAYAKYSYRVFADSEGEFTPLDHPLGNGYMPFPGSLPSDPLTRNGAASALVTLEHGPISTGDPWLSEGATTTRGNNVEAYLDSAQPDGYVASVPAVPGVTGTGPDAEGDATAAGSFDYPVEADADPSIESIQKGAVVSLFYINNWLHDFWYDHGFNEEAGNAQLSNYGRGGAEGDPILAEGQDNSGRNNANMSTPGDGSNPTMQMYLFEGKALGSVTAVVPAELGSFDFNGATFGPASFDITGDLAMIDDGDGITTDGCSSQTTPAVPVLGTVYYLPATPDPTLLGKIVLLDRADCAFTAQAQFALASGASGMVVVNNGDGAPRTMTNRDIPIYIGVTTDPVYQIPSVVLRKIEGQRIKDALAAGQTVTLRLQKSRAPDFDGTMDALVIAHEFFHYVSNRLTGLGNSQGGGMGEGWSDFNSLLLAVREDDREFKGNEKYEGAYPVGAYVIPDFYFGIRRLPYSTDFARNPLTFKHIENGVPLPTTAPLASGQSGVSNAQVHRTGEIWSNMLWNCYSRLLNDPRHSWSEARSRMQDYVIAGLKMTPSSPTMLEARDGVLAAALATDEDDFLNCGRGFAARGAGDGAVAPDRGDSTHGGVVESFEEFTPKSAPAAKSVAAGRFGGALGFALLLPLLGAGLRRTHRA